MRSRRVVGLMTVLAASALVALSGTSASAAPSQPVVPYVPLAGNGTYLIYVQNTGSCAAPDLELKARNVDGTTRELTLNGYAMATLDRSVIADDCIAGPSYDISFEEITKFFSLAGTTLTGKFANAHGKHDTVFWWDLARGRHGRRVVPRGNYYEGSIPGAWLYARNTSGIDIELVRETPGGRSSSYGLFKDFDYLVTGTRGFVLAREDFYQRYRAYGAAKSVRLAAAPHAHNRGTICGGLTTTFTACTETDHQPGASAVTESILPLDGSSPQKCELTCYPDTKYFLPTVSPDGVTTALGNGKLVTLHPDGTTSSAYSHGIADRNTVYPAIYTAYGELIVRHSSGDITEQSSVTGAQKIILHA